MKPTPRPRLVLALVLLLAAFFGASARAADAAAPTYAVLSLIGDQFTIVGRQMSTGSHLDRNSQLAVVVDDAALDGVATTAGESAVKRTQPGAATLRVSIRDPRLFALQERLFTDAADSKAMREALRAVLVKSGATHLLLAPYAYVTVALLDVATMRVVGSRSASDSAVITPADSRDAVLAWDALGAEAKVKALNNAISRAVGAAASDLLAR